MRGKLIGVVLVALAGAGLIWHFSGDQVPKVQAELSSSSPKLAAPAVEVSPEIDRAASGIGTAASASSTVPGETWRTALKNTRRETLQAIAQRASVSGRFTDIATLRVAERECQRFRMGPDVYTQSGVALSPAQLEHLAAGRARCAQAGTPSSSKIPLKDAQGMDAVAGPLLTAMSGAVIQDAGQKKQVLAAALESRSIELLEAVSRSVLTPEAAYDAGLPRGTSSSLDGQLLDLAIRVRACTARGDCNLVGMDQIQCSQMNACVDNMADFPAQKIFVPPDQRVPPFRDPNLSSDQLKARWNDIQAFLASHTGP